MALGESLNSPAPVAQSLRMASIDLLRGVAVLGILAMNMPAFGMSGEDFFDPRAGGYDGINRIVWVVCHFLFDMKMMAIFSMLFGAGVVLMSARVEAAGRRAGPVHYRRMAWLLVFGLLHAYLLWYGDILFSYAICGMLVFPFRKLRPRTQIVLGVLVVLVEVPINAGMGGSMLWMRGQAQAGEAAVAAGKEPTSLQSEMMKEWPGARDSMQPTQEENQKEIAAMRGSFREIFIQRAAGSLMMQTMIFFIWSLWRVTGLMLIGMGLMKLGMFSGQWSTARYFKWLAVGYAIGFPLVWWGWIRREASGFDMFELFAFDGHFNYVGSVFIALAHTAAIMLWFKSGQASSAARILACVGRAAFSNYILQSLICTTIFYGYGLGYFAMLERWQLAVLTVGVWAVNIIWSPLWLSHFRYGPLEWLWRSLTYLRPQPLKLTPSLSRPG